MREISFACKKPLDVNSRFRMARARSAVLQAAILLLCVVLNSAAAVVASRELLQSSPAGRSFTKSSRSGK